MAVSVAMSATSMSVSSASTRVSPRTTTKYVYGINTYAQYICQGSSVWAAEAANQVAAFKALGANAIALIFPLYTVSNTSNLIYAEQDCADGFNTPTPAQLDTVVNIAEAAGLQVFLRPELDETALRAINILDWRGNIAPTNLTTWFSNYFTTLTPYLEMAQTDHVSTFAISSELSDLALKSNWTGFIANVKKIYTGALEFTASWASNGNDVQRTGTGLGLDMYRPVVAATITSTPAQLLTGWDNLLATTLTVPKIKTVTIDEVGIPAQDGAYVNPSAWPLSLTTNPFDPTIQSNWFAMNCSFMKQNGMKGIFYYGPVINDAFGNLLTANNSSESGNLQPQTQTVMKNCFGEGSAPTVKSISPKNGSHKGGATVIITGTNFTGALDVVVSGVQTPTMEVLSNTQIQVLMPPHIKGTTHIQVVTGAGTSAATSATVFTYK